MPVKKNKKYYLLVLGCQMNLSDAEKIEQILEDFKWRKTANEREADLIVVVACSVRQAAIDRIFNKAKNWQKRRKTSSLKTILTGCVLDFDKLKFTPMFDAVLKITELDKIPEIINEHSQTIEEEYFCQPAKHQSKFSAYVPIVNGCNNFCSYCAVPYTRGREVSRPAEDIIKECRKLISSGYNEIILLGQNVNSYSSGDFDFPKLLKKIDLISGNFWIRFLTSHPKDLSDDLINVIKNGKHITPYLHLALQSGNDEILKKMNRHYTAQHYLDLISKVRLAIPDVAISTDIIVGFPGETKSQFNSTVKVMKEVKFDMAYIAKYSPRAGTAASKLKDNVSANEKFRRERFLTEILKSTLAENNQKYLGKTIRVLVDGQKDGQCLAKSGDNKVVIFRGGKELTGRFIEVKIKQVETWHLKGIIVNK